MKLTALKGGLPGKDFSYFNIAPLDPVLKDRDCGEHSGQGSKDSAVFAKASGYASGYDPTRRRAKRIRVKYSKISMPFQLNWRRTDFKKTIYELEMLVVLVFVCPMLMGMNMLMHLHLLVEMNPAVVHGVNGISNLG